MIRLLVKSALIASAVYTPLYICLQLAPRLTAPMATLMVGIGIGVAARDILEERRLRRLVRHSRLPFWASSRYRVSPGKAEQAKEPLRLAA
ncbi:MAG: hypothetical protein ACE5GA_10690 [Candidatus Zixiibacteriota bacterium]